MLGWWDLSPDLSLRSGKGLRDPWHTHGRGTSRLWPERRRVSELRRPSRNTEILHGLHQLTISAVLLPFIVYQVRKSPLSSSWPLDSSILFSPYLGNEGTGCFQFGLSVKPARPLLLVSRALRSSKHPCTTYYPPPLPCVFFLLLFRGRRRRGGFCLQRGPSCVGKGALLLLLACCVVEERLHSRVSHGTMVSLLSHVVSIHTRVCLSRDD